MNAGIRQFVFDEAEAERRDTLEAYAELARFNAKTERDWLREELDADEERDRRTTRLRPGQRYCVTD